MDTSVLMFCIFCGAVYFIYMIGRSRAAAGRMPPGERGLPLIGSLLDLTPDPPKVMTQWSKKFGDTITVAFGSRKMVVLHDYDTAKAVFTNENTTGRDPNFLLNEIFHGKGLIFSEGELWKEHRRFALSTLRDLGMGKSWFEDAILEEITELVAVFKSHSGRPFEPLVPLTLAVSNVICALVFGQRFKHTDVKFQKLCTLIGDNIRLLAALFPVQLFPFLKRIPFGKMTRSWLQALKNIDAVQTFIRGLIKDHDINSAGQCDESVSGHYIASFRAEEKKLKNAGSFSTFTDEQLRISVANLFAAGTETTTTTLLWGFIYMIEYPEIQRKVQKEIDEHVGRRPIRSEDRVLLKYTDAVTLEIQRLASTAPLGVVHTNLAPMEIDGYDIPARTLVTLNSYAMHRDPRYWKHPTIMYPEHFLDDSGTIRIPKGFAPFGVGKRECLGEPLAKMELFMFFANILQNFEIQAVEDYRPSLEKFTVSIVRSPHPYTVSFVARF